MNLHHQSYFGTPAFLMSDYGHHHVPVTATNMLMYNELTTGRIRGFTHQPPGVKHFHQLTETPVVKKKLSSSFTVAAILGLEEKTDQEDEKNHISKSVKRECIDATAERCQSSLSGSTDPPSPGNLCIQTGAHQPNFNANNPWTYETFLSSSTSDHQNCAMRVSPISDGDSESSSTFEHASLSKLVVGASNLKNSSSDGKRMRTVFTYKQLQKLEKVFQDQQYMVGEDRCRLADSLGLSETQVRVWFQNRRIKWRKETLKDQKAKLALLEIRSRNEADTLEEAEKEAAMENELDSDSGAGDESGPLSDTNSTTSP